jgi:hypothetical protein
MFTIMIWKFFDKEKMEQKKKNLLSYVCEMKMFYNCNVLHMQQG